MTLDRNGTVVRLCPRCRVALQCVPEDGDEVDRCTDCGGVWFDAGELERSCHSRRGPAGFLSLHQRVWEPSQLPCPACGAALDRLPETTTFPFDIHHCHADDGYWVDGGCLEPLRATIRRRSPKLKGRAAAATPAPAAPAGTPRVPPSPRRAMHVEVEAGRKGHYPHPAMQAAFNFDGLSTEGMPFIHKVLAFIGIPVETDRLYRWSSYTNLIIIGVNVILFVAMLFSGDALRWIRALGFTPVVAATSFGTAVATSFTAMFTHGGLGHLLGNMTFLFLTGDDIERRTGHLIYPFFFLACGLVGALLSCALGGAPDLPHIGASGAVSGMMGAYLVLCYYKSICMRWWWRIIAVPAWMYLFFWFGLQILFLLAELGSVDYAAHIGGFLAGVAGGAAIAYLQDYDSTIGEWRWRLTADGLQPRGAGSRAM